MAIPQKKCLHPSCRQLIPFTDGYCKKHNPSQEYNRTRAKRDPEYLKFYKSKAWIGARKNALIRDDYLCVSCLNTGLYTTAQLVHHKVEVRDDFEKRLDPENLESLCESCHQKIHRN